MQGNEQHQVIEQLKNGKASEAIQIDELKAILEKLETLLIK